MRITGPVPTLGSMSFGADHNLPLNATESPWSVTAMQNFADGHETEVIPPAALLICDEVHLRANVGRLLRGVSPLAEVTPLRTGCPDRNPSGCTDPALSTGAIPTRELARMIPVEILFIRFIAVLRFLVSLAATSNVVVSHDLS